MVNYMSHSLFDVDLLNDHGDLFEICLYNIYIVFEH